VTWGESEAIVSWLCKGARKTIEKTENDLRDPILIPETNALSLPMLLVAESQFQRVTEHQITDPEAIALIGLPPFNHSTKLNSRTRRTVFRKSYLSPRKRLHPANLLVRRTFVKAYVT
jgi:hypothetical protein